MAQGSWYITIDFASLHIQFSYQGKTLVLKGLQYKAELQLIGVVEVTRYSFQNPDASMGYLWSVAPLPPNLEA